MSLRTLLIVVFSRYYLFITVTFLQKRALSGATLKMCAIWSHPQMGAIWSHSKRGRYVVILGRARSRVTLKRAGSGTTQKSWVWISLGAWTYARSFTNSPVYQQNTGLHPLPPKCTPWISRGLRKV